MHIYMITSHFLLLLVGIFVVGVIFAIIVNLISKNKRKSITESFSDNRAYWKFRDQSDASIDDVVKDFKLLDD